jgi:hypothetical protein
MCFDEAPKHCSLVLGMPPRFDELRYLPVLISEVFLFGVLIICLLSSPSSVCLCA